MEASDVVSLCGLRNGQMRSDLRGLPFLKNQYWFFGQVEVGYGDLSQDDVLRIAEALADDEVFTCFNEYDGMKAREDYSTPLEKNMVPRLIITANDFDFALHKQKTGQ